MNKRLTQIGFSQRIRLEWLEQTANLVLAGSDKSEINDTLQETLKDKVSIGGQAKRGNREKIISILLKVWVTTPSDLNPLHHHGLELLRTAPKSDHLAIHWGMVMSVYPFWASVAIQVGRLLKIQGSAAAIHVQRRLREQYGERETVSRAARRVLRSYHDWGVLKETGKKGIYVSDKALAVNSSSLIAWLIETSLHSRANGSSALRDIIESPGLFPFRFEQINVKGILASSNRLDIYRHGLDTVSYTHLRAHET